MSTENIILLITIIGTIYGLGNVIVPVSFAQSSHNNLKVLPNELKQTTTMNWFGCILSSIIFFILLPIYYISKLIYWLYHI